MNLLPGLLIALCLIAFVSAEGHRSRSRQTFKVFKPRRHKFGKDTLTSTTYPTAEPTDKEMTTTTTLLSPPPSPSPSPSPSPRSEENIEDDLEFNILVKSFDKEDKDDMIEVHRPRRRKNRRQSSRRHHHRQ